MRNAGINPGQTQTALKTNEGKVIQILNQELSNLFRTGAISIVADDESKTKQMKQLLEKASEQACVEANRRYQIIEPYLSGDKPSPNKEVSIRTIQRWLSQWNQAEQLYGSGYVGLLPRVSQKGNRKQKLPPLTHKLMAECIADDYETYKQKSKRAVYGALVNACERENTTAPSYKTFLKYCNNRPTYEQTKKRQGSRSAYSNEPFYWELEFTTPRHGERPWAICHLDHTQLDIELVSSSTRALLGRPWVTFLSDAYSRRILAFYLTFDAPSYRSCMMVIRDCVSRHGRLHSFRNGSIEKTRVSVRYDPTDAGVAYAYVRKQWVRCIFQYYSVFKGRSEREVQLATQELRQQHKQHGQRFTITAKALAVFLSGTEITESILVQRLKDGEVKDADKYEPINEQNTLTLVDLEEDKSPSISAEIKPYEEFW